MSPMTQPRPGVCMLLVGTPGVGSEPERSRSGVIRAAAFLSFEKRGRQNLALPCQEGITCILKNLGCEEFHVAAQITED